MKNNLRQNNPIGIFDSGIGGLTVAHAIEKLLPNEQIIYFGDTAHLPYGDKEPHSIKHYSAEISKFLLSKNCKVIIIACHTASSIAYQAVRAIVKDSAIVINVIDPVVKLFSQTKFSNIDIGVIGTKGTIRSGVYPTLIQSENSELNVKTLETPLLCPMIEEGFINDRISQTVIDSYLSSEHLSDIKHLILACTHYPLIKKQISKFYESKVNVIDSAEVVANYLSALLTNKNLHNNQPKAPHHFYVSDFTESFEKSTNFFFKEKIHLEKKNIWA